MKIYQLEIPTTGKVHNVKSDLDLKIEDQVLVDNGQIIELANIKAISMDGKSVDNAEEFVGKIVRKINLEDKEKLDQFKKQARKFLPSCEELIRKYNLETMKLLDADLSFDEKKMTFYFSTEGRVDFRELVTDLVRNCKKIIRLQQVRSRDKAKLFGGFGKCGQELCCFRFLGNTGNITLDMAKEQEIVANSNKISGSCGKLMCCLSFELEEYRKMAKELPTVGEVVKTEHGEGKVISRNLLRRVYVIENKDGQRTEVEK